MWQVKVTIDNGQSGFQFEALDDEEEVRSDHLMRALNMYAYHENIKLFLKINDDKYLVVENDDKVVIIEVIKE